MARHAIRVLLSGTLSSPPHLRHLKKHLRGCSTGRHSVRLLSARTRRRGPAPLHASLGDLWGQSACLGEPAARANTANPATERPERVDCMLFGVRAAHWCHSHLTEPRLTVTQGQAQEGHHIAAGCHVWRHSRRGCTDGRGSAGCHQNPLPGLGPRTHTHSILCGAQLASTRLMYCTPASALLCRPSCRSLGASLAWWPSQRTWCDMKVSRYV